MRSLAMMVEMIDGKYVVDAPWLDEPLEADSWEEAYWAAVEAYR